MEIESMVANSALIRARADGGSRGRSSKWREMLRFPNISQCDELAKSIERDYYSLCVKQPIGKKLFKLFCQSRQDLQNYMSLLDALDAFNTKSDEERKEFGFRIIQRFLLSESNQCVSVVAKHEQKCIQDLCSDPFSDVFHDCCEELHQYLSGEPFTQYQDSLFFDRFLQWKMLERQPITKHGFRQYRVLGKGGFGEVWACQVKATGMMYACKKLEKTHVKRRHGEAMALNEKQILEELDSRFVVNLAYAYETKHFLCLVLTMMSGGDLKFHIYNVGEPGLDRDRVRLYAAEVCCGLMDLHEKSIIYRDLKPENILLDNSGHIRISDLGLAVKVSKGGTVKGRVGTLGYMAPEVISKKYYGTSADWWGLGCLIYEMTAGHPVFRAQGEHPKHREMENRIQSMQEDYNKNFIKSVKDLCSSLLIKDPDQRLGCGDSGGNAVKSHPFFQTINFRMLEAGLVEAPFQPDPRLVYCSDVQDIEEFSALKGVSLDERDEEFYSMFNTGSVPISWQKEIIETDCFSELNVFGPMGSRTPDLDRTEKPPESPKRSLLHRIFHRHQRGSDSSDEGRQNLGIGESWIKSGVKPNQIKVHHSAFTLKEDKPIVPPFKKQRSPKVPRDLPYKNGPTRKVALMPNYIQKSNVINVQPSQEDHISEMLNIFHTNEDSRPESPNVFPTMENYSPEIPNVSLSKEDHSSEIFNFFSSREDHIHKISNVLSSEDDHSPEILHIFPSGEDHIPKIPNVLPSEDDHSPDESRQNLGIGESWMKSGVEPDQIKIHHSVFTFKEDKPIVPPLKKQRSPEVPMDRPEKNGPTRKVALMPNYVQKSNVLNVQPSQEDHISEMLNILHTNEDFRPESPNVFPTMEGYSPEIPNVSSSKEDHSSEIFNIFSSKEDHIHKISNVLSSDHSPEILHIFPSEEDHIPNIPNVLPTKEDHSPDMLEISIL